MKRLIFTLGVAASTAAVIGPYTQTPNREIPTPARQETPSVMVPFESSHDNAYVWPTGNRVPVVRRFAPPSVRWGSGHRGVDLRVSQGTLVSSAGSGVVIFAGSLAGRPLISIEHADGLRTTYEPVTPTVTVGEAVTAGQNIGTLMPGHCGPADCLHWGAKFPGDNYINPLLLVSPQIRLYE